MNRSTRNRVNEGYLQTPQIFQSRKRTAVDVSDLVEAKNPTQT